MNKKRNLVLIIIFGLLLIAVIFFSTYAYFQVNSTYDETLGRIAGKIDCLNITYTETNVISLSNKYPITDDYAMSNLVPVTVNVVNNCTNTQGKVSYTLTYTSLSQNSGYIPDSKIRIAVKKKQNLSNEGYLKTPMYVSDLESLTSGDTYTKLSSDLANRQNVNTYTNKTNYIIDRGTIGNGETNTYKVYLWIDYYEGDTTHAGLNNNSTQNLNYKSALSLVLNTEQTAASKLILLAATETEKITKYTGKVTDRWEDYGVGVTATNVYVFTSNDINNVIFEGYCWKIIRTTETGGIKLLYNGTPITVEDHEECVADNGVNAMLTAAQMNTANNTITYSQEGASNKPAYVGYMYNPNSLNSTYYDQLRADNVNQADSLYKEKIEYWFSNSNIDEDKLEDAVYCNDRSLATSGIYISPVTEADLATATSGDIYFKSINQVSTLECTYQTDSFNTTNTKAQTNYKVGFMTEAERYLIGSTVANSSNIYWLGSPYNFGSGNDRFRSVGSSGTGTYSYVGGASGVRPVVTASSNVMLTSGDGSTTSPFILE